MIVAASFDVSNPDMWFNRGLQYGDGLFETMRCHQGILPLWELHRRRIHQDLQRLGMTPPDWSEVERHIESHITEHQVSNALFKLNVFRGGVERGYGATSNDSLWVLSIHPLNAAVSSSSVLRLELSRHRLSSQPLLAGMKHTSRLEQVMIANQLNNRTDVDDLLVFDCDDHVIETTCQNVVFIKDNDLITPDLEMCGVHGVALAWLETMFVVKYASIKKSQLNEFDAMMVGNSIRGFRLAQISDSGKTTHSFFKTHPVHDKISEQWDMIFDQ